MAVFFQDAEIAKLSAMLKKAEMKTSSLGMSWETNVAFTPLFRTLILYTKTEQYTMWYNTLNYVCWLPKLFNVSNLGSVKVYIVRRNIFLIRYYRTIGTSAGIW